MDLILIRANSIFILIPASANLLPFTCILRLLQALPYEQAIAPITSVDAAGQVGPLGVATGAEVQLGDVKAELLSPINLEDFPNILGQ